jgi:hypothetical protein
VPGRRRRDNSIDALPDGLRDLVREMLTSKAPRYSYAQIVGAVEKKSEGKYKLTGQSLNRYWSKGLEEEMAEQKRIILAGVEQRKQVEQLLKTGGSPERLTAEIMGLIDSGILANTNDITTEGTVGLVIAKSKLMQASNDEKKLALAERRLAQQAEKFKLEKQKLERDLEKQRRDEERRKTETLKAVAAAEGSVDDAEMYRRALKAIHKAVEG